MNILFLLSNYPGFGGIEKVTTYITSYLRGKGYSLSILTFGTNAPQLMDELPKDIKIDFVPEPHQYNNDNNTAYIRQYLSEHDFDFVVLQDSYAPIENILTEIDYPWKQKLIIVEHNSPMYALKTVNSYFYYQAGLKFLLERIVKYPFAAWKAFSASRKRHSFLMANCRKYVLLSDSFRSELKALVRKWEEDIVITITNPLTISKPIDDGVYAKKKQILFVGRLTNQKGLNFLLPIWEEFTKCNKMNWGGYNLVILGDGPLHKDVELYIRNHSLSNIRIDAPTSDVAKYYEESEILVMTSIFEGFPLVLAESMSRGCIPFVFDSYSSVHDIVDSGRNGMLIKPFKVQDYANGLSQLVHNAHQLNLMSTAARETIKKFDIEAIGNQWVKLFKELYEDCIYNKSCQSSSDTPS